MKTGININYHILLRVNAEESRAVGVSGLQSNRQTTTLFGRESSHSLDVVDY